MSNPLSIEETKNLTDRFTLHSTALRNHHAGREALSEDDYKEHLRNQIEILERLNHTTAGPKATPAARTPKVKKEKPSTDPMDLL